MKTATVKNGLRPKARQSKTSSSPFTSQTRRRMGVTDATVILGLGRHDETFDLRLFPASLSDSNHEGGQQ